MCIPQFLYYKRELFLNPQLMLLSQLLGYDLLVYVITAKYVM